MGQGVTTTCTIFLNRLGAIVGAVLGVLGDAGTDPAGKPSTPLGNVTLTAHPCTSAVATPATPCATVDPAITFTAVSAADGSFRIVGTVSRQGLDPGWWQVTGALSGYSSPGPVRRPGGGR